MKNKYFYDDKKQLKKYVKSTSLRDCFSQGGSAFRNFAFFACHKQKKHEKHE